MRQRAVLTFVFAFILLVAAETTGWSQCVMCRTALLASEEGRSLAASLRSGILMLLGAPYLMFGALGYVIFRAFRNQKDPEA